MSGFRRLRSLLFATVTLLALSPIERRPSHSVSAFVSSSRRSFEFIRRDPFDDAAILSETKIKIQRRSGASTLRLHLTESPTSSLDVARSTLPSVALILPRGVRNTTARGSGFVVDFSPKNGDENGDLYLYLLTAAHVAAPGHRIRAVFFPESRTDGGSVVLPAAVVGRCVASDLALLRIRLADNSTFRPPPPLALSTKSAAEIGTLAYAAGYPSGGVVGPAMTSGIVCGNALGLVSADSADGIMPEDESRNETNDDDGGISREETQKTRYVVTDAAMAGGMSGGPLVEGSSGTVLGLNALIHMELRALGNYAVSAAECIDFLNDLNLRSDRAAGRLEENDGTPVVYRVILYNDRFNKRARVQDLLENVAKLNVTESNRVMMDAHTRGRGVVQEFRGDDAEARILRDALRKEDLLVEVETVYKGIVQY